MADLSTLPLPSNDPTKPDVWGAALRAVLADLQDGKASAAQGLLSTSGKPNNALGVDGQFALDATAQVIYRRTAGAWDAGRSLLGPQGPAGPTGVTGAVGAVGAVGAQGVQGPAGPQGPQGIQGVAGSTGLTFKGAFDNSATYAVNDSVAANGQQYFSKTASNSGHTPPTGTAGDSFWGVLAGAGPAGATGATGAAGAQGPTGAAGAQGIAGKSAYELAVAGGFSGTQSQFLASLVGAQGPQGVQGATGSTGATGAAGSSAYQVWLAAGNSGTQAQFLASLVGAQGPQGATGSQGVQGVQGPTGSQGPAGVQGPTGPTGPAGVAPSASTIADLAYDDSVLALNKILSLGSYVAGAAVTLAALEVTIGRPPQGTPAAVTFYRYTPGTSSGFGSTIGQVVIPAGKTSGQLNTGLTSAALAATDLVCVVVTGVGSTFPGQSVTARVSWGSAFPGETTLTTPTGVTASPTTGGYTVNWTTTNGAYYELLLDGVPVVDTPLGTGFLPLTDSGNAHNVQVLALGPKASSALSAALSISAYQPLATASNGAVDNVHLRSLVGAGFATGSPTNAPSVLVADDTRGSTFGKVVQLRSGDALGGSGGTIGGNNALEQVLLDILDGGNVNVGGTLEGTLKMLTANTVFQFFTSSTAHGTTNTTIGNTVTGQLGIEISASKARLQFKAASINSGSTFGLGSTTAPSPTYSTLLTSSGAVDSSGYVTKALTPGTTYGWKFTASTVAGDGSQTCTLQIGTTSEQTAGTMPVIVSATLLSAPRTALAAGISYFKLLNRQTADTTHEVEGVDLGALRWSPLVA